METFLTAVLSFPTIIFTIALAFVLLYATLILFGPLTLESIFSIDATGRILDVADAGIGRSGILTKLGVRGVPFMILAIPLVLSGWAYSFLMMSFWGSGIGGDFPGFLVKSIIGIVALGLGAVTASALIRPFRGLFVTARAGDRTSLVGSICTVQSGSVDAESGRGEIADGGPGFLAEVRCMQENDLGRGSTALVCDYDRTRGVYVVAPLDEDREIRRSYVNELEPDTSNGGRRGSTYFAGRLQFRAGR